VGDGAGPFDTPALLLDGVQDPGNVGALVRTAAWFGVQTVVGDEGTADFENPKAVRASMGGLWDVALARVPDLGPVLDRLAAEGAALWGADLGGTSVAAWAPGHTAALVMGSEAHGLSADVAERLHRSGGGLVHIPGAAGARGVESLNVSVAGGVLLARWLG
jgi:TrmH family RNA methyltransferase